MDDKQPKTLENSQEPGPLENPQASKALGTPQEPIAPEPDRESSRFEYKGPLWLPLVILGIGIGYLLVALSHPTPTSTEGAFSSFPPSAQGVDSQDDTGGKTDGTSGGAYGGTEDKTPKADADYQTSAISVDGQAVDKASDAKASDAKASDAKASDAKASGSSSEPVNLLALPAAKPHYYDYELEEASIHVIHLPADTPISVVVADELTTIDTIAEGEDALAVLNGGFFDPQNGMTTSHLIANGQPAGDPLANERLTENPVLQEHLAEMLNRSEFRTYNCQGSDTLSYEIDHHTAAIPSDCTIVSSVGGGPQLLPTDTSIVEAFTIYEGGNLVRDAIDSTQPNARSAIALREDKSVLLIMVGQRPGAPGLTLAQLAEFSKSLGAKTLLHLDGGSSSTLYYDGDLHFGRIDAQGNPLQRPIKSAIVIGK